MSCSVQVGGNGDKTRPFGMTRFFGCEEEDFAVACLEGSPLAAKGALPGSFKHGQCSDCSTVDLEQVVGVVVVVAVALAIAVVVIIIAVAVTVAVPDYQ